MATVEESQHIYFPPTSENPPLQVTADEATDPNTLAAQQAANGYAVYYPQQHLPIQQYATFYQGQQYVQPYGGQPTPTPSPTIDPTTGQPTMTYVQGTNPHTPQPTPGTSPAPSRRSRAIQDAGPYFRDTEQHKRIYSMDRSRSYKLRLFPKIDRGFFLADNDWTCYRRNYFQVSCSFSALDAANQKLDLPCFVETETGWWTVTQFLINVAAKTSTNTRDIELVQHTAKRDKGPQLLPQPRPCDPQSGPIHNFRQDPESRSVVTFERLQFKSATANNGKRRAAQQYHIIVLELFARCDNGTIIKVAICESAPLVVRGRAPGHYAQIGQKNPPTYDFPGFPPADMTAMQGVADFPNVVAQGPQMVSSPGGTQVYAQHYPPEMHQYYQYQYPPQTQQYQYAPQQFSVSDPSQWAAYTRQQEEAAPQQATQQDGTTADQLTTAQSHDSLVHPYVTDASVAEGDAVAALHAQAEVAGEGEKKETKDAPE